MQSKRSLEAEHTPCVGPRNIMSVVHTPLLRPSCATPLLQSVHAGQDSVVRKSRAGLKHENQGLLSKADMRKLHTVQTSPNLLFPPQVNLNKSPALVGGRMEMFGNISEMISHWEGEEKILKG